MRSFLRLVSFAVLPLLPAALAAADGFDPVEEIETYRMLPPSGMHRHHRGQPPSAQGALMVDCSGMHRGMFSSVNAAIRHATPGARILILPPGQGGATCVESVDIRQPLTIASFGGGADAVIQAPRGMPCLTARIPLGDALTIDGIRFVARGREAPCLRVQAGRIAVRSSTIDSRSANWAFDVAESAELSVADSHIETDGSGIHAFRARIALTNVDIDIEAGRDGVGLDLAFVDGTVEGGTINGGAEAIVAAAGARDLRIVGVTIRKAETGVKVAAGGLGTVILNRLAIDRSQTGIAIEDGAEADITGNIITEAWHAGIAVAPEARARIDGNTITVVPPARCIAGRPGHGNICHPPPPPPKRRCVFLGCLFD